MKNYKTALLLPSFQSTSLFSIPFRKVNEKHLKKGFFRLSHEILSQEKGECLHEVCYKLFKTDTVVGCSASEKLKMFLKFLWRLHVCTFPPALSNSVCLSMETYTTHNLIAMRNPRGYLWCDMKPRLNSFILDAAHLTVVAIIWC